MADSKITKKNLLAVGGIISIVIGLFTAIPALIKGQSMLATLSAFLVILGIILLAIAFGE